MVPVVERGMAALGQTEDPKRPLFCLLKVLSKNTDPQNLSGRKNQF